MTPTAPASLSDADLIASPDFGTDEKAANLIARRSSHSVHCGWHGAMSIAENWDTSRYEDPTAEWCQGEPTVEYLAAEGLTMSDAQCECW